MKSSLARVYTDLLEFFHIVSHVFIRADGSELSKKKKKNWDIEQN